jgi:very-short-patch-repair endonuclease
VAGSQYGAIALDQLLDAGLSYEEVKGWVERGHLLPVHRGVFLLGHRNVLSKAYLVAALLAAGPEAFLSHRTAAAVWGLREVALSRIDVTVPGRKRCSRGSLRLHRTTIEPDTRIRDGLRVSSFPQMLIELAHQETSRELERLITWGVRKRFLSLDEMRDALVRHRRRRGITKLKKALAAYLPTHDRKSELERDFDHWLARHPEIRPPKRNVYIDGWEIDCYWPEFRLAVELDGRPYHIAAQDMEKDKYKDGKLLTIGIRTLRITDTRFNHDQPGLYNDLTSLMRPE